MFIQVRASNPASDGRSRAGRRFTNGQLYRMEVVDGPFAGGEVDQHGNAPIVDGALAMDAIDSRGYEALKADPCFSVLEGGSTDGALTQAAFDGARAQLKAALGKLVDADIENAALRARVEELEDGNLSLKDQASALAIENAALRAKPADAPVAPPVPVPAAATPATGDDTAPGKPKKK